MLTNQPRRNSICRKTEREDLFGTRTCLFSQRGSQTGTSHPERQLPQLSWYPDLTPTLHPFSPHRHPQLLCRHHPVFQSSYSMVYIPPPFLYIPILVPLQLHCNDKCHWFGDWRWVPFSANLRAANLQHQRRSLKSNGPVHQPISPGCILLACSVRQDDHCNGRPTKLGEQIRYCRNKERLLLCSNNSTRRGVQEDDQGKSVSSNAAIFKSGVDPARNCW